MKLMQAMYSLSEAAAILRCEEMYIIERAAAGDVSLYIKVPANVELLNVGFSDLQAKHKPDDRLGRPQPVRSPDVYFLQVPARRCQQIINAGICFVREFAVGGTLDDAGTLRPSPPPIPQHYSGLFAQYRGLDTIDRYFACYPLDTDAADWRATMRPTAVEVVAGALRISRESILVLQSQWRSAASNVLGLVELKVKPHTSLMLRQLCELHDLHFRGACLPNLEKLMPVDVTRALTVGAKPPSQNLVKCALWIVDGSSVEEDAKTRGIRIDSTRLRSLVRCADELWGGREDGRLSNPTNSDVAIWLHAYGYSRSMGQVAASLIRPDGAPKGRPPQQQ